ncbi:hypothetical protein N7475_009323 [Penicillium sp. IBT 31633x]|nr:hypothetical protein N7475_009323 [Penicillium sp. IBT 31633x]
MIALARDFSREQACESIFRAHWAQIVSEQRRRLEQPWKEQSEWHCGNGNANAEYKGKGFNPNYKGKNFIPGFVRPVRQNGQAQGGYRENQQPNGNRHNSYPQRQGSHQNTNYNAHQNQYGQHMPAQSNLHGDVDVEMIDAPSDEPNDIEMPDAPPLIIDPRIEALTMGSLAVKEVVSLPFFNPPVFYNPIFRPPTFKPPAKFPPSPPTLKGNAEYSGLANPALVTSKERTHYLQPVVAEWSLSTEFTPLQDLWVPQNGSEPSLTGENHPGLEHTFGDSIDKRPGTQSLFGLSVEAALAAPLYKENQGKDREEARRRN